MNSFTVVAPRLSAVYDVEADGELLLHATAGRYYRTIALDIATREFGRLPNGADVYDEYAWNPATLRYDRFLRRSAPASDTAIQAVDPYHKDEVSAGIDWQFGERWVLVSRLMWHQIEDMFWSTDQYDAQGRIYRDVRNWDAGWRDYRGVSIEVNRSFGNGWAVRTNYTLGEAEGNRGGGGDTDTLFEGLGGVEVATGRTDATIVNRAGRTGFDRTHIVNLLGSSAGASGSTRPVWARSSVPQRRGLGARCRYHAGASGVRCGDRHLDLHRAARRAAPPLELRAQPHRRLDVPGAPQHSRPGGSRGGERDQRAGARGDQRAYRRTGARRRRLPAPSRAAARVGLSFSKEASPISRTPCTRRARPCSASAALAAAAVTPSTAGFVAAGEWRWLTLARRRQSVA